MIVSPNTLNRANSLFVKLLNFNLSLLLAMSLHRLILFMLVVKHWLFGAENPDVAWSFFTGVRFDLCILGFMNIPVLFAVWIFSMDKIANSSQLAVKLLRRWLIPVYLALCALWINALALLDLMFFSGETRRLTLFDVQDKGWGFIQETLSRWGMGFFAGVVVLYFSLWAFRSVYIIYQTRLTHDVPLHVRPLWKDVLGGFVLPLLAVILAARGTWTPHHLALEHAQVSQIPALQQLALSPVWVFDKKF